MPVEKPKDFRGTIKRLAGYVKPRRHLLVVVVVMAALGTAFNIVSPKIMGLATTSLFDSFSSGSGVDFAYIRQILIALGGLYLISSLFYYAQQYIM